MPMEHLNENGELCQGYYCAKCGKGCGMYGHKDCVRNPPLVRKIAHINNAGSLKKYTFNKLKGMYDDTIR